MTRRPTIRPMHIDSARAFAHWAEPGKYGLETMRQALAKLDRINHRTVADIALAARLAGVIAIVEGASHA